MGVFQRILDLLKNNFTTKETINISVGDIFANRMELVFEIKEPIVDMNGVQKVKMLKIKDGYIEFCFIDDVLLWRGNTYHCKLKDCLLHFIKISD